MRNDEDSESKPWISLREAATLFGIKLKTAQNAVALGKFLPTYKLGKRRVVDRAVIKRYFEIRRSEGLDIIERRARRR